MKQQKIVTYLFEIKDQVAFSLDSEMEKASKNGWHVVQIVSTSFEKHRIDAPQTLIKPILAITLLLEKD